jgi:hypothetical protein
MPTYIIKIEVWDEDTDETLDNYYGPYDFDTAIRNLKDWTDSGHLVTMIPIRSDLSA